MGVITVQNDFSHGEISREAYSRFDTALYKEAASSIENLYVRSLGQASRRFGTKFIVEVTADEDEYRLYKFDYQESDTEEGYLLLFTNNNLKIYRGESLQATLTSFTGTHGGTIPYTGLDLQQLKFAQANNLLIITHPDHYILALNRGATHTTWALVEFELSLYPCHDFVGGYSTLRFDLSDNTVGTGRTLHCNSAIFSTAFVGGLFQGLGDLSTTDVGLARITAFTDTQNVTVDVVSTFSSQFKSPATVLGSHVILAEPAFSSTRGFPVSCGFHQNRLVFGGAKSLSSTIFMSKSNDYYNFDVGKGNDGDAIQVTLGTHEANSIRNVVSSTSLQVFTTNAEFTTPPDSTDPLTPGNIAFITNSSEGCVPYVRPLVFDDQTIFIAKGGQRAEAIRFAEQAQYYKTSNISLLSPDNVSNPIDVDVFTTSGSEESKFYILINDNGQAAFLQSMQQENVVAWSHMTTDGVFKRVTEVNGSLYFLVKRTINGVDKTYLEIASNDFFMDSYITQTFGGGATVITGLSAFEGKKVSVIGDNYYLGDFTVSGNQVTVGRSSTNVTVGLIYTSTLRLLPVEVMTQTGPSAYTKKRLTRLFVDYFSSLGITLNSNIIIPDLAFGPSVLDQIPVAKTGLYETTSVNGWGPREEITLTTANPFAMTILGVGMEVTV